MIKHLLLIYSVRLFLHAAAIVDEQDCPCHGSCGQSNPGSVTCHRTSTGRKKRVVQYNQPGRIARDHAFPFMVYIVNSKLQTCCGFIIDCRHAITAGHCVEPGESVNIYYGMNDVNDRNSTTNATVYRHPEYVWNQSLHSVPINDIAVLVTANKLTFSAKVQPICLTTQPIEAYHDTEVVVAGWGYFELDMNSSPKPPEATCLRYGTQTVRSDSACAGCAMTLKPVGLDAPGSFCTSNCQYFNLSTTLPGDSGAPLFLTTPDGWTAVGIVSSSVRFPAYNIHTDLYYYINNWRFLCDIVEKIRDNGC